MNTEQGNSSVIAVIVVAVIVLAAVVAYQQGVFSGESNPDPVINLPGGSNGGY